MTSLIKNLRLLCCINQQLLVVVVLLLFLFSLDNVTVIVVLADDESSSNTYVDNTIYRDNTYYPNGMSNPYVDKKKKRSMYWRDSDDLLNNLHLFQIMAVKFHSCVWSPSSTGGWNGNNNNNNNDQKRRSRNLQEEGGQGNDDNDVWYSDGLIPPSRANLAFSLYGKLKPTNRGNFVSSMIRNNRTTLKCNSNNYINSFYTTSGFDVFVESLQSVGITIIPENDNYYDENGGSLLSSTCTLVNDDNGFQVGETVACRDDDDIHQFGLFQFNTTPDSTYSTCYGTAKTISIDPLNDFNSNLTEYGSCAILYMENGTDSISNLLQNSASCTIRDSIGKNTCPDPYGTLKKIYSLQKSQSIYHHISQYGHRLISSYLLLFFGTLTLLGSVYVYWAYHNDIKLFEKKLNTPLSIDYVVSENETTNDDVSTLGGGSETSSSKLRSIKEPDELKQSTGTIILQAITGTINQNNNNNTNASDYNTIQTSAETSTQVSGLDRLQYIVERLKGSRKTKNTKLTTKEIVTDIDHQKTVGSVKEIDSAPTTTTKLTTKEIVTDIDHQKTVKEIDSAPTTTSTTHHTVLNSNESADETTCGATIQASVNTLIDNNNSLITNRGGIGTKHTVLHSNESADETTCGATIQASVNTLIDNYNSLITNRGGIDTKQPEIETKVETALLYRNEGSDIENNKVSNNSAVFDLQQLDDNDDNDNDNDDDDDDDDNNDDNNDDDHDDGDNKNNAAAFRRFVSYAPSFMTEGDDTKASLITLLPPPVLVKEQKLQQKNIPETRSDVLQQESLQSLDSLSVFLSEKPDGNYDAPQQPLSTTTTTTTTRRVLPPTHNNNNSNTITNSKINNNIRSKNEKIKKALANNQNSTTTSTTKNETTGIISQSENAQNTKKKDSSEKGTTDAAAEAAAESALASALASVLTKKELSAARTTPKTPITHVVLTTETFNTTAATTINTTGQQQQQQQQHQEGLVQKTTQQIADENKAQQQSFLSLTSIADATTTTSLLPSEQQQKQHQQQQGQITTTTTTATTLSSKTTKPKRWLSPIKQRPKNLIDLWTKKNKK